MEKDELKVTSSENKQDVAICYCITNGKISDKRYNKHLISIILMFIAIININGIYLEFNE
jgi:hypothetical protein